MILLPTPKKVCTKEGNLKLNLGTMIVIDGSCPAHAMVYARMLKEEIHEWAGLDLAIVRGAARAGDILLKLDAALGEQAYHLEIAETGATLCGGSNSAVGYAVATLRQIVRQYAGLLPCLAIDDEPMLKARGFYHDATRGRIQTLENLKKLADTMAFYKLNQLQLNVEHTYLFRGMSELWRDDTPLTAEEIMEFDEYCFERGIELVPSLATFGHLYKLLSSRTYEHLCEMPDSAGKPFSFEDRMALHTVNVSDPDSIKLIKEMITEYMSLFRTNKFNICADETFALGKGRSKALADEKGVGTLYVDYICELFDFLKKAGKQPMFWGDIICRHPEQAERIPKDVICLNWGYSPTQREYETQVLAEAGVVQYVCPGACGWNTWVNILSNSYYNVKIMTGYAKKHGAVGMLNTDWGDFGHVNHPVFSIPGLIYGAVFAWSGEAPEFEEINRQISELEFTDRSGKLLGCLKEVSDQMKFSWHNAVKLKEHAQKGFPRAQLEELFYQEDMGKVPAANETLGQMEEQLRVISRSMDTSRRGIVAVTLSAIDAMRNFNDVGVYLSRMKDGKAGKGQDGFALAQRLENCLYHYKKQWLENSKQSDLEKVAEVFYWYADLLRNTSKERNGESDYEK